MSTISRPEPPFLIFEAFSPHTVDLDNGGAWTPVDVSFSSMGGNHWTVNGSTLEYDDEIESWAMGAMNLVIEGTTNNMTMELRPLFNGIPRPPTVIEYGSDPVHVPGVFAVEAPTGGPAVVTFEARRTAGAASGNMTFLLWEGWINGRWR